MLLKLEKFNREWIGGEVSKFYSVEIFYSMYGPGLMLLDYNLGILYLLAMSSLATYGILLAGWSANSKYAFLGSLRSTAQLISYELILSSAILLVVLLAGSLDITVIIEAQRATWYIVPLLPIFLIFFIGSIAETNRAPFDLAEASFTNKDLASLNIAVCWKLLKLVKFVQNVTMDNQQETKVI